MKLKNLLISMALIIGFTSCEQTNKKEFTLKGNFSGKNTEYLRLSYMDSTETTKVDTLVIKDGKFSAKGFINYPESVYLMGNMKTNDMEDPNLTTFFMEPGTMDITLKEDDFKNAKITGSKTQEDYETLNATTNPIYMEINTLISEVNKLEENKRNGITDKDDEMRIKEIRSIWAKKLKDIKAIRLKYASQHPDSYLSPYLVSSYRHNISEDSLKMYYGGFEPKIKQSSYSDKIKEMYELAVVKAGDKAPDFTTTDANGNPLSLNKFKGKYVLLDFWAGWCVPCLQKLPELKRIYQAYHPKGLEIIGVSFDKDEESWHKSIAKSDITWNNIFVGSNNYNKNNSISKNYSIQPIPAYILIDKEGVIIDRYLNADSNQKEANRKDENDLENSLKQLLGN